MSQLVAVGTAVPPFPNTQSGIDAFMADAYRADPRGFRKYRFLSEHSGIAHRHSWVADFSAPAAERTFFPTDGGAQPDVAERMAAFRQHALPLAVRAVADCRDRAPLTFEYADITHLITVSCTGLSAPGLDVDLSRALGLRPEVHRVGVNFMGCNAAFPALKVADAFARADPDARVLIVCTELSTAHFQPKSNASQLLANTLFADGAAAVLVTPDAVAVSGPSLRLRGFRTVLATEGAEEMQWHISPHGFLMTLTGRVPKLIRQHIAPMFAAARAQFGLADEGVAHWAVHPGGTKILEAVQDGLSLSDAQMAPSFDVLARYGNMSSPSILFVVRELIERGLRPDEQVVALGFGPGLSMEAAALSVGSD